MFHAKDGKERTTPNRASRRLTHVLLALTLIVQPGCMCGCSVPAVRMRPANRNEASSAVGPESPAVETPAGACCAHCSPPTGANAPASHAP